MDKSFETLYKIAMMMADTCLTDQSLEARFKKLDEEVDEMQIETNVIEGFEVLDARTPEQNQKYAQAMQNRVKEMGDVLFVLLHAAHKMNMTAHDLLHMAVSKMTARLNDPNYIAKEQR